MGGQSDTSMSTCPRCGGQNRAEARFCQHCGAELPRRPAAAEKKPGFLQTLKRWLTGEKPGPAETPSAAATQVMAAVTSLQPGSVLERPHDTGRRYGIVTARQLDHSTYYDALDLSCPVCGAKQARVPQDGLCGQCRSGLTPVLIHERARPEGGLSEVNVERLVRLSSGQPDILSHHAIVQVGERAYTIVEHPGRWGVLVRGRQQRSPDEALAAVAQVARALAYLHDHGFAHCGVDEAGIEGIVTVGNEQSLSLADLSGCVCLDPGGTQTARGQINRDISFLALLLAYLVSGTDRVREDIDLVPAAVRPVVERAAAGSYGSVQEMMEDAALRLSAPAPRRPLRPSHGQATHAGLKRPQNEDAVFALEFEKEQDGRAVPTGFYLVADGMGGHDAGDVASRTVSQVVSDWVIKAEALPDLRTVARTVTPSSPEEAPGKLLAQAIRQANETLVKHGRQQGSDLGSTVTAALVIGDVATIANVGDSRTYLLHKGRLEQITRDHSLVARLVEVGVIQPEEAHDHPHRSRIYRTLGHKADVEVDVFTRQLHAGDALLLCSDGLWDMVPDSKMRRIIEGASSPQEGCDVLVEEANRAGGEDNIGVVLVQVA